MKIQNKEVIQSYLMTSAKYMFSTVEKRIMYKIIEMVQGDIEGKKLNKDYSITKTLFNDRIVKIKTTSFLKHESDRNYGQIKEALTSLRNKTIEFEKDGVWKLIGIIEKPKIDAYKSYVQFEVQPEIWEAVLNFDKGYSKYELEVAMSFNSVFSMRFYELFNAYNRKPMTIRIDTLKERFGITDKYKLTADFIKNVVKKAKNELDEKCEYSFNYSTIKEGRKITKICFVPTHIPSNGNDEAKAKKLQKEVSLRHDFDKHFLKYLNDIGFTNQGVRNNIALFRKMNKEADLFGFIKDISRKASEARNPQGYVIGAMKTYLKKIEFVVKVDEEERAKMNDILGDLTNDLKA